MQNHSINLTRLKPLFIALSVFVLTGCASFSVDGGMDRVSALTKERTGQPVRQTKIGAESEPDKWLDALLAKPLTPDSAVEIALSNNRGLQAALAELGIAEADWVRAGRIGNPSFSFERTRAGRDVEIERTILFDLLGLLTIPLRSGIEAERFEQAKVQAAADAVKIAADTRRTYFNAVAAQQTLQYMEEVKLAAEAGSELAARMAKVGNWSKLDQAREQVFYADATAQYARAQHNAKAAREQLTRMLGLWGRQTEFKLAERLPEMPKTANDISNVEQQAMLQRLDVQLSKRFAESTAHALGLSQATGFINVLHAGYTNRSETDSGRANGYEIELELPIFDWGRSRTTKAEAIYMQSVHRAADTAIRARSEVREAYSAYRTSYDLAKHYRDEIVPLRKRISDEILLRYNGMLASVFELLADARTQIASVNAAIEAQRDFWIADTELQMAINGTGGSISRMSGGASAAAAAGGH
jgi:outer membrane protein TolC